MADVISAEEGALRRGAQAVRETKSGIDQQTKKVRGEIEQLRGFWTGAAAASVTTPVSRGDEQALAGTERDQAATEEAHQQTIAGLGSMMGA